MPVPQDSTRRKTCPRGKLYTSVEREDIASTRYSENNNLEEYRQLDQRWDFNTLAASLQFHTPLTRFPVKKATQKHETSSSQEIVNTMLKHILRYIENHVQSRSISTTKLLGLTGLQGSGKSTWTPALVKTLNELHDLPTINLSLDDLYLDHSELVQLHKAVPFNKILQSFSGRGASNRNPKTNSKFFWIETERWSM